MSDLDYEQLIEEASNPRNQIHLDQVDAVAKSINSSCGDSVIVEVQYSQGKNNKKDPIIKEISWQGSGCIISKAGMSVLSEMAKGKTISELQNLTPDMVMDKLGMDQISPGRIKCLTLGLSALKQLS